MSKLPSQAKVIIIGAGIVGNSLAYHLARLGWRDIVLLDKGALPNPGGSTGHASNFIFPVDHSKEITMFTLDSVRQYHELGVFTQSGGIEVARTTERMEELKRRVGSAKSWGVEAELISPLEIQRLVPYVNSNILLGGFYTPAVGTVDSLRAGTLMRDWAVERDALRVYARTEITALDINPTTGRISGVRTTDGDIRAETVVICCGVWSPRLAAMAGASIPLSPAVHQMISVGPVPLFADSVGEIEYPILRDMDAHCYERQLGSDMEVGSYGHRPILLDPDQIPSVEQATLSPTELPFTKADFDPSLQHALELIPDILGDPSVAITYAINGLLSLTSDGLPVLGETPEVKGLWSVAAVWIKEGPGIARCVAEWMTTGSPEIDPGSSDVARFSDSQKTNRHIRSRCHEGFNKTYGIVHPREQWASNRDLRLSPFHAQERALGAVFFETAGWERPNWYESNATLLGEYGERTLPRRYEWDARWWSPIINAEHLAMRDRVGMVDLSAFAILDIIGPSACSFLQNMAVARMDVSVGRVVYTQLLNDTGGIKADLTVIRLGVDHFRAVTGAADGMRDKKWLLDHLPPDGSVQVADVTAAWATIGVWGPRARELVQSATPDDMSDAAHPLFTARWIELGASRVLAARISYVGELGWEIHMPFEQGARVWDTLWQAGESFGVVPVGIGVYGTTARLEKGYRLYGADLEQEYTLVEAGLTRPRVKLQPFIGKEAYLHQRAAEPSSLLCTLTVDDNTSRSGFKRFPQGREPILNPAGEVLVDRLGRRSFVTSAGTGPTLGSTILLSYLPPASARIGIPLSVEYFGERYPVRVAAVGNVPLFDPQNTRMKG